MAEIKLIRGEEILLKSDSSEVKLFVDMDGHIVSSWSDIKGMNKHIVDNINTKG